MQREYKRKRGLSILQWRAISILLEGGKDAHVADVLGLHRTTVTRWRLYDFRFQAELNRRRRDLDRADADRLRIMRSKALRVVERSIDTGSSRTAKDFLRLGGLVPLDDALTRVGSENEDRLERSSVLARFAELGTPLPEALAEAVASVRDHDAKERWEAALDAADLLLGAMTQGLADCDGEPPRKLIDQACELVRLVYRALARSEGEGLRAVVETTVEKQEEGLICALFMIRRAENFCLHESGACEPDHLRARLLNLADALEEILKSLIGPSDSGRTTEDLPQFARWAQASLADLQGPSRGKADVLELLSGITLTASHLMEGMSAELPGAWEEDSISLETDETRGNSDELDDEEEET